MDARADLAAAIKQLRRHILDVALAGVDRLHLACVDVDRDHLAALLREGDRERQPYVAQPDHADCGHSLQSLEGGPPGM